MSPFWNVDHHLKKIFIFMAQMQTITTDGVVWSVCVLVMTVSLERMNEL